jgi:hypothetical protein
MVFKIISAEFSFQQRPAPVGERHVDPADPEGQRSFQEPRLSHGDGRSALKHASKGTTSADRVTFPTCGCNTSLILAKAGVCIIPTAMRERLLEARTGGAECWIVVNRF